MEELMRFPEASIQDLRVADWFSGVTDPFRLMVRPWFARMRECGPDIREVLHDGCPTACVEDAAFAYVNAFSAHASIGFFRGTFLADPAGLLEGQGKRMRHVKLKPGQPVDEHALTELISAAYQDMRRQLASS